MGVNFVTADICRVWVAGLVLTRSTWTLTAGAPGILADSPGARVGRTVFVEVFVFPATQIQPILIEVMVMTGMGVLGVINGSGEVSCGLPLLLRFRMSQCLYLFLLKSLQLV